MSIRGKGEGRDPLVKWKIEMYKQKRPLQHTLKYRKLKQEEIKHKTSE